MTISAKYFNNENKDVAANGALALIKICLDCF